MPAGVASGRSPFKNFSPAPEFSHRPGIFILQTLIYIPKCRIMKINHASGGI